jgi:hypothetical protein
VGGTGSSPEIAPGESEAGVMNSHEYANKLKELADFLLAKPEFETDAGPRISLYYWSQKEAFLGAVKALGKGRKEWTARDLDFRPDGLPDGVKLLLNIQRESVCRKVQEEKWECEPLLSQAEEAEIGA